MPLLDVLLGDIHYHLGIGERNVILRIGGNWRGPNVAKTLSAFRKAVEGLQGKLFLSLKGCLALDALALEVLLEQQKLIRGKTLDIILVDVPSELLKLLEARKILGLFEIFPSLQDAVIKYGAVAE